MNKKLVGFALAFIFIVMLAAPLVSAKPTSATNNPKAVSFMWHSENGADKEGSIESRTNPPWAVDPADVIVTHTTAAWELNPLGNNYVQIDDEAQIPIDAETGYEGTIYVQSVNHSPTLSLMNYRVYETIMWGEGNYIEIMCNERASFDAATFTFYASGTFSGHGVIDGQKVQVTGIREGSVQEGIGFVLECYGTIRFAGNA